MTVHEIHRKEVTYLNDPKTPCQPQDRDEEMNTCIQHHIESVTGCKLPWHVEKTALPTCILSDQYTEFIRLYDKIAGLSSSSVANETGCLPSCKRNEYSVHIIDRTSMPDEFNSSTYYGFFFYPSGRYIKKDYYYTYDFDSYIADVGGLVGLFLGQSLLSFYDILNQGWKNKKKFC